MVDRESYDDDWMPTPITETLYANGVPILTVLTYRGHPVSYSVLEHEMAKQQLAISQALEQQKLGICPTTLFCPIDTNICQAKQFNPIDTGIWQAPQYMPKIEPESLPEPEPMYKEKINVKWYELLILAALAWAPFMLGLLLKFLNS